MGESDGVVYGIRPHLYDTEQELFVQRFAEQSLTDLTRDLNQLRVLFGLDPLPTPSSLDMTPGEGGTKECD